jgi:hypothetical protein
MWLSLICAKKMLFFSASVRNGARPIANDFGTPALMAQIVAVPAPRHAAQEPSAIEPVVVDELLDIVVASGPSVARVVEPRVVAVVVLRHVDPPRNRDDVHDPRQNAFIPVRGSGITFWCRWSSRI